MPLQGSSTNKNKTRRGGLIGSATSLEEIIAALAKRGCQNLTHLINHTLCGDNAFTGGGFCDVYQGVLLDTTKVAIKVLRVFDKPGRQNGKQKILKRAAREMYYWSRLKHHNVLPLMGFAIFRGHMSMVSEWMDHGDLRSYIEVNPGVNRMDLCIDVCVGLRYIHKKGMVHGDLKAANVMISPGGSAMLADFGNSQLKDLTLKFTNTTQCSRSIRWTAPELLRDDNGPNVSKEADVYAYAMTVLETLTGKVPYHKYTEHKLVFMLASKHTLPTRPTVIVSDGLWNVLTWCWARDPSNRPSTKQIRHWLRGLPLPILESDTSETINISPRTSLSPRLQSLSVKLPEGESGSYLFDPRRQFDAEVAAMSAHTRAVEQARRLQAGEDDADDGGEGEEAFGEASKAKTYHCLQPHTYHGAAHHTPPYGQAQLPYRELLKRVASRLAEMGYTPQKYPTLVDAIRHHVRPGTNFYGVDGNELASSIAQDVLGHLTPRPLDSPQALFNDQSKQDHCGNKESREKNNVTEGSSNKECGTSTSSAKQRSEAGDRSNQACEGDDLFTRVEPLSISEISSSKTSFENMRSSMDHAHSNDVNYGQLNSHPEYEINSPENEPLDLHDIPEVTDSHIQSTSSSSPEVFESFPEPYSHVPRNIRYLRRKRFVRYSGGGRHPHHRLGYTVLDAERNPLEPRPTETIPSDPGLLRYSSQSSGRISSHNSIRSSHNMTTSAHRYPPPSIITPDSRSCHETNQIPGTECTAPVTGYTSSGIDEHTSSGLSSRAGFRLQAPSAGQLWPDATYTVHFGSTGAVPTSSVIMKSLQVMPVRSAASTNSDVAPEARDSVYISPYEVPMAPRMLSKPLLGQSK